MRFQNLLQLMILLALGACKGFITDVEGPRVDSKLVVFSVVSPEIDTLEVRVHKSLPLDVPNPGMYVTYEPVRNAEVKIKHGTSELVLQFINKRQAYAASAANFPILPGNTYRLEVSAPDGYAVWAECTVPNEIPNALEVTKVDKYPSDGFLEGRAVSMRLADLPGTGHFYYVDLARRFRPMYPGGPSMGFDMIGFETGEQYLTDANKDGAFFLFRTFRFDHWAPRDTLILYSALTDRNFFRYHQSVRNFTGDNPFSEPTPIFTNIVGGLGVFAACRERKETYILE